MQTTKSRIKTHRRVRKVVVDDWRPVPCSRCKTTGMERDGDECRACQGTGHVYQCVLGDEKGSIMAPADYYRASAPVAFIPVGPEKELPW